MNEIKREPRIGAATDAADAAAEAVDPARYRDHFQAQFRNTPYYTAGREWRDYEPAYRYGYDTYGQYRGQHFDEIEGELQRKWDATRAGSRLAWSEARQAVRDGWLHIDRHQPGDGGGGPRRAHHPQRR